MKLRYLIIFILAVSTFACNESHISEDHNGDYHNHEIPTQTLTIERISEVDSNESFIKVKVKDFEGSDKKDNIYYSYSDGSYENNLGKPVKYSSHLEYQLESEIGHEQKGALEILSPYNEEIEDTHLAAAAAGKLGCIGYIPFESDGHGGYKPKALNGKVDLPCYAHFQTSGLTAFIGRLDYTSNDSLILDTVFQNSGPSWGLVNLAFEKIYYKDNHIHVGDFKDRPTP